MVLKTSKWYQTVRLVMSCRISIGTQHDLPRSNFHVELSRTLRIMLFVMTSGDLNIDLTKKKLFYKSYSFSTNYQTPFEVCRYNSCFLYLKGGKKAPCPISSLSEPAWNRAKSESVRQLRAGHWSGYIQYLHRIETGPHLQGVP